MVCADSRNDASMKFRQSGASLLFGPNQHACISPQIGAYSVRLGKSADQEEGTMEITISVRKDGKADVRTSLGHHVECDDEQQAVVYSNGLRVGYNAAVSALGRCHGFQIERKG